MHFSCACILKLVQKGSFTAFQHLAYVKGNVSKVLKVNNTVVDNELGGTDITLKIDPGNVKCRFLSGFLRMEDKELCAVRWSGSFVRSAYNRDLLLFNYDAISVPRRIHPS